MAKQKEVSLIIMANLTRQGENGKILIDGYSVVRTWKNFWGKQKFHILKQYKNDTEAILDLNRMLEKPEKLVK